MTMEARLKFLDQASQILPSVGELPKISCHLLYLRELFMQYGEWSVPKSKDPFPSVCQHCFMEFKGSTYSLTLNPRPTPSCSLLKIMQKDAASQHLTRAQTVLLSRFRDSQRKKLVLKCSVCQRGTEVILGKNYLNCSTRPSNNTDNLKSSKNEDSIRRNTSTTTGKNASKLKSSKKGDSLRRNTNTTTANNADKFKKFKKEDCLRKNANVSITLQPKRKKKKEQFAGLKVAAILSLKTKKKK